MTYKSRGRSLTEVIIAATVLGFVVGFVCVLCIGNYYRAKRASERQRQRRLARNGGLQNPYLESPKSASTTSGSSEIHGGMDQPPERQHLLAPRRRQQQQQQHHNHFQDKDETESLLFQVNDEQAANLLGV